jgi:radical SAM superfamily enzyme YgiQ (UPF0313 family)
VKIGLLAMSGVRVVDPDLIALGLNLPGFVERSRVIASLPSLSLLTLAALTPRDIEVEYREIADSPTPFEPSADWDLVAIATYTAQAKEAYAVADRCRAQGLPVVMGGLHVTACPEEARLQADAVVVGEGEPLWPRLLADFRAGTLRAEYRQAPGEWFDLADSPVPRHELLDFERYNRLTVQTARGCPHRCEFCAASPLLVPGWRMKPVERVIAEIHHIRAIWPHPFIEFADDNSFPDSARAQALMRALRGEGIK